MLFLELALIRWLGANIVHLSYFSNFVLLGSFLGIGLGFLISRKRWSVLPWTGPLLAVLVVVTLTFPVSIQRQGSDVIYFTALKVSGPPAWIALPVVFVLVAATLAGPAETVGRCFGELPPLSAYRYDLLGSLIGIGSSRSVPVLGALRGVGRTGRTRPARAQPGLGRRLIAVASAAVITAMLLSETLTAGVSWSPYYKVTTIRPARVPAPCRSGSTGCLTRPWRGRLAAGPRSRAVRHAVRATARVKLDNVLVVGAGSGTTSPSR